MVRCKACAERKSLDVCRKCQVPLCTQCFLHVVGGYPGAVPESLANDNFWEDTAAFIYEYAVTWLEVAVASPCWNSLLVYYVEGDRGHLLNEPFAQQKWRTRLKGSACSFRMPWEDIVNDLRRNIHDGALKELPRSAETITYFLRVHLRLGRIDFATKFKHMKASKQLRVRPFIVLRLLHWLIDRNHPIFRDKGTAVVLKQKMDAAVAREYPETEEHRPVKERTGHIPESILRMLDEQTAGHGEQEPASATAEAKKRRQLPEEIHDEKNATPGAPARPPEQCLDDLRPLAVTMDRSNRSATDPAAQREGAFEGIVEGDLNVHTSAKFVDMWEGQYVSMAFPFAVTRGVSGPDFRPDKDRGRRANVKKAPILKATSFMKMLSRRSSAAVRSDWTLVPTVRSSTFKWQSEHIFAIAAPFALRRQAATKTSTKEPSPFGLGGKSTFITPHFFHRKGIMPDSIVEYL